MKFEEGSHLSPLRIRSLLLLRVPHMFCVGSEYRLFPPRPRFWERIGTSLSLHCGACVAPRGRGLVLQRPCTRSCVS